MRSSPNIIITGTPGVGKTTHCESLAEKLGLKHVSVNQIVKDKECHEGWDDEYQCWIVDEDKVGRPRGSTRHSTKRLSLTYVPVAGCNGRRCKGRRLYHRLARLRSISQELG